MTIDIITEDRDSNEHAVNRMSYEVYTIPLLATLTPPTTASSKML
jgi:hypothetical protein